MEETGPTWSGQRARGHALPCIGFNPLKMEETGPTRALWGVTTLRVTTFQSS